jgi:hypothetical protein
MDTPEFYWSGFRAETLQETDAIAINVVGRARKIKACWAVIASAIYRQ